MLSALKHFKDQTDPALPSASVQPDVASEAGTWMAFPGSGEAAHGVHQKQLISPDYGDAEFKVDQR